MLSALTSYLWGSDEDTDLALPARPISDQLELEDEWIFIRSKEQADKRKQVNFNKDDAVPRGMEESWLVTPPQCFSGKRRRSKNAKTNPMENLLIEHPSMSIYKGNEEDKEEEKNTVIPKGETHKAVAGRLQELAKRLPLKDLNIKTPQNLKRKNLVYVRAPKTRQNKQYGRKSGKHVGMVAPRTR
jgi:hypothetical protein